jgi:hypothetical protein
MPSLGSAPWTPAQLNRGSPDEQVDLEEPPHPAREARGGLRQGCQHRVRDQSTPSVLR